MLIRAVSEGPQSIGLSNLMPPFKPTLSDAQISDVVAYIRTLAEPAYDILTPTEQDQLLTDLTPIGSAAKAAAPW